MTQGDIIGQADKIAPRQKIDILVPAHGRVEHSIECIEMLYERTFSPFHLIICDDSEVSKTMNQDNPVDLTDTSQEYFEKLVKKYRNITYVRADKPFISGNHTINEAIKHMETPYLATIMNSIRVQPDWERIGIKLMNENPKIGVVGFKCIFPDTRRIECAGIEIAQGYMPVDMGRDLPSDWLTTIQEVNAIQWAFALIRREACEGNLDERVYYGFKGWDDIDNCFALRSKGWKIFYCGYGVGVHYPRSTRGTDSIDGYLKNKENAKKFWKRWGFYNKYLESRSMDVSDKISNETKENLKAVYAEFQMCENIKKTADIMMEGRKQILKTVLDQTLKNVLHVEPNDYVLGVDIQRDMWDLKRKGEPEVVDTVAQGKPNEVPKAIPEAIEDAKKNRDTLVAKALKDRAEAMQKVEQEFKKAEEEVNKKFEAETAKVLEK